MLNIRHSTMRPIESKKSDPTECTRLMYMYIYVYNKIEYVDIRLSLFVFYERLDQ